VKIDSKSTTPLAGVDSLQRASLGDAKSATGAEQDSQVSAPSGQAQSTVSLSALSSDLRASNSSDVDTAKVESIKAAMRDGSLTMDSSKIADGLLGTVRDLLKTPSTGG
jgi:negative regulator of flagellin synthesis FlgM